MLIRVGLVALIVLSTIGFVVGTSIERGEPESRASSTTDGTNAGVERHREAAAQARGESAPSAEGSAHRGESAVTSATDAPVW